MPEPVVVIHETRTDARVEAWHACLDAVRDAAIEYLDIGRHPDVGAILARLRARYPRYEQGELDRNPARVAARRIEARRG